MDYKDYYKILGVAKDASAEDIKKAYRRLARKYHPDLSKEPDAAQRMAEVNEAHTVLSDPDKRATYDQLGDPSQFQGGFTPPPGWHGGAQWRGGGDGFEARFQEGDFSSFFEELFGRGQQFRRGSAPVDRRGQDQHASIALTVPESYAGTTRALHLRAVELDAQGHAVEKQRELHVTIPKGVHEGQLIRLAGKGQPGTGQGAPGDLLLQVQFASDKRWHTDGKDVYQQLPLTPWEAALGGPITFDTLAGPLEINIPAGTQPGRKLRVKGKGLPAKTPGDLYLVIELTNPVPTTEAQRQAYAELAKAFAGHQPR